jgi:hypothetical protein
MGPLAEQPDPSVARTTRFRPGLGRWRSGQARSTIQLWLTWFVVALALLGNAWLSPIAEADSSGVQYENALPAATGATKPPTGRGATARSTVNRAVAPTRSQRVSFQSEVNPSAVGTHRPKQTTATITAARGRGNRYASQRGVADSRRKGALDPLLRAPTNPQTGGGSTSPQDAIFIGITALAAALICIAVIRRRRCPAPDGDTTLIPNTH